MYRHARGGEGTAKRFYYEYGFYDVVVGSLDLVQNNIIPKPLS